MLYWIYIIWKLNCVAATRVACCECSCRDLTRSHLDLDRVLFCLQKIMELISEAVGRVAHLLDPTVAFLVVQLLECLSQQPPVQVEIDRTFICYKFPARYALFFPYGGRLCREASLQEWKSRNQTQEAHPVNLLMILISLRTTLFGIFELHFLVSYCHCRQPIPGMR